MNDAPIAYSELRDGTWYRIPEQMVENFVTAGVIVRRTPAGAHFVKYECSLVTISLSEQRSQP